MSSKFGAMLKKMRLSKRCNFLELNVKTGIVINHLRAIENGQVHPDEDNLYKLQNALELTTPESKKFWREANLDDQKFEHTLDTEYNYTWSNISHLLDAASPYPSMLLDESMTIVKGNMASTKLFVWLLGMDEEQAERLINEAPNLIELILLDEDFKKYITNWPQVAVNLVERNHDNNPRLQTRIDKIFELLPPDELQRMQGSSAKKVENLITKLNFKKDIYRISLEETQTSFIFNSKDLNNHKMTITNLMPRDQRTRDFFNLLARF
ncbi:MAG: hypothetical protein COB13_010570 [OCS116 cluster bacterium]|nr:hypothetical protein [OCS116 cluster bacterium]